MIHTINNLRKPLGSVLKAYALAGSNGLLCLVSYSM